MIVLGLWLSVGCRMNPAQRTPDAASESALGRALYEMHCLGCHGARGDGQGPAAVFLHPRPRDFVHERFRIRSTVTRTPPSDADLLTVLTMGIPGSPMPSFAFLSRRELRAVIGYLKSLSPAFSVPPVAVELRAAPPPTPATLAAGRALYTRLGCDGCHGEAGRGDGDLADGLVDDRDLPIRCRDLARDPYKGGTSARDIYLRLSSGMDGTPMSNIGDDAATVEQRWQLAAYVASLRPRSATLGPVSGSDDRILVSRRARDRAPGTEPLADEWNHTSALEVQLSPLMAAHGSRRASPVILRVRSLHDRRTIAFRLEWPDATRNDQADATEKFADGAAIQFVVGGGGGFLGMGAQHTPVQIWHWRADWQRALEARPALGAGAAARSDADPMPFPALPARDAGNPYVAKEQTGPVEEGVAAGFGTLTARSVQRARGGGAWKHDTWYVVLSRDLDGSDVSMGSNVKLAFAVWDGENRDRGAQKAISSWYRVIIDTQ